MYFMAISWMCGLKTLMECHVVLETVVSKDREIRSDSANFCGDVAHNFCGVILQQPFDYALSVQPVVASSNWIVNVTFQMVFVGMHGSSTLSLCYILLIGIVDFDLPNYNYAFDSGNLKVVG